MDERTTEQFTISKTSPVPLYFQLKTQLVELLKQRIFQAEGRLPIETEFCELLGISRPTVRQAFSELINEGYITRHKTKGTFASRSKVEGHFFQKLKSFDGEMRSLHLTSSIRVVTNEVIELSEECAEIYPRNKRIFHLQRSRYTDHGKMVLVNISVPYEHFLDIELEDFEQSSSYDISLQKYQTEVTYVSRTVEARKTGQRGRTILNTKEDGVLMYMETVIYTQQDEPVEYSITEHRRDRNEFKMRLICRED